MTTTNAFLSEEHLDEANVIRLSRYQIKSDVENRRVDIREILRDPPECVETMRVAELILCVKGFGKRRTFEFLRGCDIFEWKSIKSLTPRQRDELIEAFPDVSDWNFVGMPQPPERNLEQQMSALEKANEIRFARAKLKKDIKAKRVTAQEILLNPPDWAEGMQIYYVLMSVPKWGEVKTKKAMKTVRMSMSKTVSGITERQRAELISLLPR